MNCLKCGSLCDADSRFCANCGSVLPEENKNTVFCGTCGTKLSSDDAFCGNCGSAINGAAPVIPAAPAISDTVFCGNCGTKCSSTDAFCGNCGGAINGFPSTPVVPVAPEEVLPEGAIYNLNGVRGRHMIVFEDRVVLRVKATIGSFITGNISDGEKTIYFSDCIGVQFKESGFQIGYLQFETAGRIMNNSASNFFNENTFTWDTTVQSNEFMRQVADYTKERVSFYKQQKNTPVVQSVSAADELIKFKELLDMGIITQEEFDKKKQQILGF